MVGRVIFNRLISFCNPDRMKRGKSTLLEELKCRKIFSVPTTLQSCCRSRSPRFITGTTLVAVRPRSMSAATFGTGHLMLISGLKSGRNGDADRDCCSLESDRDD